LAGCPLNDCGQPVVGPVTTGATRNPDKRLRLQNAHLVFVVET
jgi:hypothetical protein